MWHGKGGPGKKIKKRNKMWRGSKMSFFGVQAPQYNNYREKKFVKHTFLWMIFTRNHPCRLLNCHLFLTENSFLCSNLCVLKIIFLIPIAVIFHYFNRWSHPEKTLSRFQQFSRLLALSFYVKLRKVSPLTPPLSRKRIIAYPFLKSKFTLIWYTRS